jgi:hypothetical protein
MKTSYRQQLLGSLAALIIALTLLGPAARPATAQETTEPTPAAEPVPAPTQPSGAVELFTEDLGPATVAISDTAAISDTILGPLGDYLNREKSGVLDTALADVYGDDVPARPKAGDYAVYLPMLGGRPLQSQPGPVDPGPGPVDPQPKGANITVAVWPSPSIRVARDGSLAYEIRVYNDGEGSADSTRVTLPFDRNLVTVTGSRLDRGAGDWVSEVRSDAVVVTFGELGDKKMRTGWVYFRVNAFLADNTVLSMRPAYRWSDERGTTSRTGNWAPVLVGGGNDGGAYAWTIVQPVSGWPGELRTFYSNRFAPGEVVTAWLNTPNGVVALDIRETADEQGQVWVDYRPSRLAAGSYQMVIYGNRSRLTGVASFVVW